MKKVLMRGAPEAVAQFASPVSILCLNYVLLERIGAVAVNAFSVICYTASFSVAVFYGVSEGMQPLIGQAYGEKNTASLKFYFRASLAISLAGSLLVYGVLRVLDAPICLLFGVTGETLGIHRQRDAGLCLQLCIYGPEYHHLRLPLFHQAHPGGGDTEHSAELCIHHGGHFAAAPDFRNRCCLVHCRHL